MNDIQLIEKSILDLEPAFERINTDKSIVFAREAEFAIQIITNSNYCLKIAKENPQSVRDAVTNIAAMGVSLNPARKQAYLVPRKGGITLVISYMGLLDIAIQSGSILWGQAEIVYAADLVAPFEFTINGYDQPPTHKRNPFAKDRGEIVGVYVVVKTRDGDYLTTTMTASEVWDIRERSDAWQGYMKDKSKKCPWVTDETEMVKKTVIKRAYKTWPKTERLDNAVHHLNTAAGEGITFAASETPPQATAGLIEGATKEIPREQVIHNAAMACIAKFETGDEMGAFEEVEWVTDSDEMMLLWGILGKQRAKLRNTLKRLAAEARAKQENIDKGTTK